MGSSSDIVTNGACPSCGLFAVVQADDVYVCQLCGEQYQRDDLNVDESRTLSDVDSEMVYDIEREDLSILQTTSEGDKHWEDAEVYAKTGPCPECGAWALNPGLGGATCDKCHEDVWKEAMDIDPRRQPVDIKGEVYSGGLDGVLRGTIVEKAIMWVLEIRGEIKAGSSDRELTPTEKYKKNLANLCFILGLMFCVTIIGIPFGVLFFVLAAIVTPDLGKNENT